MRSFVCAHCQAITKRLEGALPPNFCPHCRKTELFEIPSESEPETGKPETDKLLLDGGARKDIEPRLASAASLVEGKLEGKLEGKPAVSPFVDDERPCDRGETCARFEGKDCPGGRGC